MPVKILIFGATGMVGEGILRWMIDSSRVDSAVAVSRRPLQVQHPKLHVVIEPDMFHLRALQQLTGFDACFFCLGTSSVGMTEADYRRTTCDLTVAIGQQLKVMNPQMIFEFISGEGASPRAVQMWGRVKAEAEAAVFALGFRDTYVLRPGYIQPMRGAVSRIRPARWSHYLLAPVYPLLQKLFNPVVTSTDLIAAALMRLATLGNTKKTLSNRELNALGRNQDQNSA